MIFPFISFNFHFGLKTKVDVIKTMETRKLFKLVSVKDMENNATDCYYRMYHVFFILHA